MIVFGAFIVVTAGVFAGNYLHDIHNKKVEKALEKATEGTEVQAQKIDDVLWKKIVWEFG